MPQDYRHNWNQRCNTRGKEELTTHDSLLAKYDIYLANTDDDFPMSFDEWLNN